ncbi:MAG: acetolactate synthase small subunit [Alphaproteobacteria bacterium]|jgi:acetolactate synthase-1/3 small subunit|nr:acetolactate synthase small subunit [Alphaproteobacteria bacterium]
MSETERHTIIALVDNEPGVLARVVGLFSGRGYNIESLTVSSVSVDESLSRMTIVTSGTPMIIEQIKAQVNKLVPIHAVHDLTAEGAHLEREIALVKVVASGPERRESLRIADIFNATVADTTTESFVFSLTGKPEKVDAFIELMRSLGRTEIARSGVVGIARGAKAL